jgi:outer membrane protein
MNYSLAVLLLAAACQAQTQAPVVRLSLKRAVEIALSPEEGNTRVQLAAEMVKQAQARSAQARASLLPDFEASVATQNLTRSLAAMGIRIQVPIPGFTFPDRVGPFSVYDARATMTTNLFDFGAIRRYQASRTGIRAAEAESDGARDQVASLAARAYIAALRAGAQLEAARANVTLGEALLSLAENQKAAGTGTGIEVTRARAQLANQKQQALVAETARTRAHLQLLRALNLRLEAQVELTDRLVYAPHEAVTAEQAVKTALETRADLKAQRRREDAAGETYSSVKYERLPSVVGFADYGAIGASTDHMLPTRTYGVSLRVPVFDGGRRDARRVETGSQLRQERIRAKDLAAQIELEVRTALDALRSAEDQVKVAEEGLTLSENELAQAERRYKAGVANSLEVTDAQTRLERARDNRIAALYAFNQAGIELAQATGTIRGMF